MAKKKKAIVDDLIAGLSVAMVSIPEGIGFAMIVGINPIYGLYTGIIATIIGALSTGSPFMVVTLTNTLAISAASVLTETGNEGSLGVLFMLTIMVGIFQLLMGVFKMGSVLRFISNGVMTGFVLGSALLVIIGQLGNLTGYHSTEEFNNEFAKVRDVLLHYTEFDVTTMIIGFATIALIILLQRVKKIQHSAYAVALVIMTVFVTMSGRISTALVGDHVSIPSGVPSFALPDFSAISILIIPALAVALVGLIDAAGVVALFGDKKSKKIGPSRDFIGQGLANTIGGFFGGLPAGGSFSRTALNVEAGAKTRAASVFAGIITMAIVLFFATFIELIPHSVLAGMLILIGFNIIMHLRNEISVVWHTSQVSLTVMVVTFIATLAIPLYYAIFVGVALSLILYVFHTSMKVKLVQINRIGAMRFSVSDTEKELSSNAVTIVSPYGNIFFAVAGNINHLIPSFEKTSHAVLIFRLREHKLLNSTAIKALKDLAEELRSGDNRLVLSGVHKSLLEQLQRVGADEAIGKENIFVATDILEESTEKAWTEAQKYIQ